MKSSGATKPCAPPFCGGWAAGPGRGPTPPTDAASGRPPGITRRGERSPCHAAGHRRRAPPFRPGPGAVVPGDAGAVEPKRNTCCSSPCTTSSPTAGLWGSSSGSCTALYEAFSSGQPSPLPELPIQYADFAVWQRQWLQGEVLESTAGLLEAATGGSACPCWSCPLTVRARRSRPSGAQGTL